MGAGGLIPSNRIVIGHWGTGGMGSGHVKAFTAKADVQAVVVCDVNRAGTNYAGNRLGGRELNVTVIEEMYAEKAGAGLYKGIKGYRDFRQFLHHDGRRTGKRPICHVEIGCRSVTACLLGEIATRPYRPLKCDPKRWRFPDDCQAQVLVSWPMRSPWVLWRPAQARKVLNRCDACAIPVWAAGGFARR